MKLTTILVVALLTVRSAGAEVDPSEYMLFRAKMLKESYADGRLNSYRIQLSILVESGKIEPGEGPVLKDQFLNAADLFFSCDISIAENVIQNLASAIQSSTWKKIPPSRSSNGGIPRSCFQIIGPWNRAHLEFLIDPIQKAVSHDGGATWYKVDEKLIKVMTGDFIANLNSKLLSH